MEKLKLPMQNCRTEHRPREDTGTVYDCLRDKMIAASIVIISCLLLQPGSAAAQSLDEIYQRAKKEGRVVVYAPLSAKTEEIVFPAFRRCVAGITFMLPVF
jgi:hypothetical protein